MKRIVPVFAFISMFALPVYAYATPTTIFSPATTVSATSLTPPKVPIPSTYTLEEPETKSEKEKGSDSWWKVLLGGIIEVLLLFLSALALALGGLLVRWITKKLKVTDLEKTKQYEDLYNAAISLGVNFAKQQAHRLKNSPDAKAKRMEWAVDKATELITEFSLPDKTAKWIRDRIEAKIGEDERK